MDEITQLAALPGAGKRTVISFWMVWVLWLGFLISPISDLFHSSSPLRIALVFASVIIFVVIYLWTSLYRSFSLADSAPVMTRLSSRWFMRWYPWPAALILTALAFALSLGVGPDWVQLFYYVAACVGGCLPTPWAIRGIIALDILVSLGILARGYGFSMLFTTVFLMSVIGIVVIGFVNSAITSRQLRAAREEIAYLAVAAERLRIARDLHDLLGHSLSLIALKSELAKRLAEVAPERAAREISDIERAAREALQEVREAVTGYRQPTLASELREARSLLAAAGIAYHDDIDEQVNPALSPALEAALSWTVREGVTNVIRHSRARRCDIQIRREGTMVRVEIFNDCANRSGSAPAITSERIARALSNGSNGGNGLRGLNERVTALGGCCENGPSDDGGYRLAVSVPVTHVTAAADVADGEKGA